MDNQKKCYQHFEVNRQYNSPLNEEPHDIKPLQVIDEKWIADHMEHSDNYNEHDIEYVLYDLPIT